MKEKKIIKTLAVALVASLFLNVFMFTSVNKELANLRQDINGQGNIPPTADVITWERAQQLIGACQVSSVSQTHDLQVLVQTKTGDSYAAVEPEIDAVFKEVNAANCEDQPVLITE